MSLVLTSSPSPLPHLFIPQHPLLISHPPTPPSTTPKNIQAVFCLVFLFFGEGAPVHIKDSGCTGQFVAPYLSLRRPPLLLPPKKKKKKRIPAASADFCRSAAAASRCLAACIEPIAPGCAIRIVYPCMLIMIKGQQLHRVSVENDNTQTMRYIYIYIYESKSGQSTPWL